MEKVYDYVIACSSLKGRIADMKVIKEFESRPHKAVTFVVERGKERQERNGQKLPKTLPGKSGGRLPGRSTEEKGREEGEEDEGIGERQVRNEVIEVVIRSFQKVAFKEVEKNERIRTGGLNPTQSLDCSQI